MARYPLLAVLLACLVDLGAALTEPLITMARLRSINDDWGQKLKMSYTMVNGNDHELCVNCKLDEKGQQQGSEGYVEVGGTCGGLPNGCHTVKKPKWGTTISISIREANPLNKIWPTPSYYFIDPEKNDGGMHELQPVDRPEDADSKEEL